eukprot:6199978-Pleurochrysis_carterae.AAC.6
MHDCRGHPYVLRRSYPQRRLAARIGQSSRGAHPCSVESRGSLALAPRSVRAAAAIGAATEALEGRRVPFGRCILLGQKPISARIVPSSTQLPSRGEVQHAAPDRAAATFGTGRLF